VLRRGNDGSSLMIVPLAVFHGWSS
jgi:hypothetical protein